MTLRLDPHAAATVMAAHHAAADAVAPFDPPGSDAGEATGQVHRLLDALRSVGDHVAEVNDVLAMHVQEATDNIEATDLHLAQGFRIAVKRLP
ncbi:hypothetical protein G5V58_16980 [Nocardioides anomalus]|uniref:Uncharacterized protein n=1 Tax=Nocardioides anomalus TaxID=2712223 RepID=A0A6G6WFW9_9ACTN|nr:hypothetical protein [Nocardioides anomalus]QIG44241.1 hypothetical protein G5V58_16980 [Nocardioides anomalus]